MCCLIQFELLYIEVLYTIKHKIGATSGCHLPFIQDLYAYVQDAFQLTPDEHARLLGKASEEKVSLARVESVIIHMPPGTSISLSLTYILDQK